MNDVIRIVLKGSSGYCCVDEAYEDKITITPSSISYEYKPVIATELNIARKWSYRTTSPVFSAVYEKVRKMMPDILDPGEVCHCTDVGGIEFIVTYSDKSKRSQLYFCDSDNFIECFRLIKQMVPTCEYVPAVLLTSDDFENEE